jgi:hypothetical protein
MHYTNNDIAKSLNYLYFINYAWNFIYLPIKQQPIN